jgi:hypothetical protein
MRMTPHRRLCLKLLLDISWSNLASPWEFDLISALANLGADLI